MDSAIFQKLFRSKKFATRVLHPFRMAGKYVTFGIMFAYPVILVYLGLA